MTTVWSSEGNGQAGDAPLSGPRLHALIIGVSSYPHLDGGSGAPGRSSMHLSQLTSPQHSAVAVKEWLIDDYAIHHAGVPLGSVELVVSPLSPAVVGDGSLTPATMAGVTQAINGWFAKCNSHEENIAFFYFCGHGIAKDNQFLLTEEFGDPNNLSLWANCINFDGFRVGMSSNRASKQIFFVDACRQLPDKLLNAIAPPGAHLIDASYADRAPTSATYYATSTGMAAYGRPNATSFFCDALIRCLKGLGAAPGVPKWAVNTYTLASALGHVMPADQQRYRVPLRCNSNINGVAIPLVQLDTGRVLVCIRCLNDPAADRHGRLDIIGANGNGLVAPMPLPYFDEIEPGNTDVLVTFAVGTGYGNVVQKCLMMPPVFSGLNIP